MTDQITTTEDAMRDARECLGEDAALADVEAFALSVIFQCHYLDPKSAQESPDNFSSCICGEWSEGSMEPGWDDHLAEVAIGAGFRLYRPDRPTEPTAGEFDQEALRAAFYGVLHDDETADECLAFARSIIVHRAPDHGPAVRWRNNDGPWRDGKKCKCGLKWPHGDRPTADARSQYVGAGDEVATARWLANILEDSTVDDKRATRAWLPSWRWDEFGVGLTVEDGA
jgi:hypothetical protein